VTLSRPNLFRFAARELHQDAFVAWLLDWARVAHRDADPERHRVGRLFAEHLLRRYPTTAYAELADVLEVRRQWKAIDVMARFALADGRQVIAVIENKTVSTLHNPLDAYCKRAEKA
jgi:hypothetical protein